MTQQQQNIYTLFSRAHATLTYTDHILGCKTNLNQFKRLGNHMDMLSDCNRVKLEISNRKRTRKPQNAWK